MAIFLAAVLLLLLHPQDARPLPDPGTFYAAVREKLVRVQQVTHRYAYKERRTDLHTNPFRRIGTAGTRVTEVYPSANTELTYRRLVERNGVLVGAAELAEQDRAYRRHVADVERRADRRTADDRRRRAEEDATARQRANAMIDDVVDTGPKRAQADSCGVRASEPLSLPLPLPQNFAGRNRLAGSNR